MKPWLRNSLSCALVLVSASVSAQSMPLKTVPIATGEQFLIFPSRTLGMGSLGVAHEDALQDGFGNPGRGGRVQGTWFAALPTFYQSTVADVGGRTLPFAMLRGGERWFGSIAVAMQQVE